MALSFLPPSCHSEPRPGQTQPSGVFRRATWELNTERKERVLFTAEICYCWDENAEKAAWNIIEKDALVDFQNISHQFILTYSH